MISILKKHKIFCLKILGLVVIYFTAILIDHQWNIPDNPITFPLLVILWVGILYVLVPRFFNIYKTPILLIYGFVITYFVYVRLRAQEYGINDDIIVALVLFPMPVLLVLWFYDQWKSVKTLRDEKTKAELQLLKNQINPHFFFNTLNNLYGLTIEKSDKAPDVILKLSDMMRFTIYEGNKDEVSIHNEIDYLTKYIELHKIRYQERIKINFEHVVDHDYKIAPLLFIVLLENAFKHGAESLIQNAYINIKLEAINNVIFFEIENNFKELDKKIKPGIGIANLKQRLSLIYLNKNDLKFEIKNNTYKATLKLILK